MELKIIDFIKTHKNWRELLSQAPYHLRIVDDGRYTILTYNQVESDFNEIICHEARGLIIDTMDNFKVVRMAFKKFFNIDESYATTIDWSTASALEKIDGSIMSVWYANNEWHVSTNNVIDARKAEVYNKNTNFYDIFMKAVKNTNLNFDDLDKRFCYTFELVSPETRIVIAYPNAKLYHLTTRDMTNLEETDININVEKPKRYSFTSESNIRYIVSSLSNNHEGVVVCDNQHNRVKIKTESYLLMHHLRSSMSIVNAIKLVKLNDYHEFVSYFKEYKEFFEAISYIVNKIDEDAINLDLQMLYIRKACTNIYQSENNNDSIIRKRFVEALTRRNIDKLTFARIMLAYNGKLYNTIKNAQTMQSYIRLTRNYWIVLSKFFPDYLSIKEIISK